MSEEPKPNQVQMLHVGWQTVKSPVEIIVDTIVVDHTARILDLEKQVAELRALLTKKGTDHD